MAKTKVFHHMKYLVVLVISFLSWLLANDEIGINFWMDKITINATMNTIFGALKN